MNRQDFTLLMQRHFQTVKDLNEHKGNDYAGKDDALANFKRRAEQCGITPMQVWSVYAGKHWDSIMTFVRDGKLESEPIEGRILDEITYLFLLLGLLEEKSDGYSRQTVSWSSQVATVDGFEIFDASAEESLPRMVFCLTCHLFFDRMTQAKNHDGHQITTNAATFKDHTAST